LEAAITFLKDKKSRLAVSEWSWGVRALLSRTITNASDYAGQAARQDGAAAQPAKATVPMARPSPQVPVPPSRLGSAGSCAAVHQRQSRTAAAFFASIP